jgi:pimeloyl-ACP methyl ester carboxylesterase
VKALCPARYRAGSGLCRAGRYAAADADACRPGRYRIGGDGLRAMCLSAGTGAPKQIEALPPARGGRSAARHHCPTLSIVGELDRWSPPVQHEQIAALIPGAALSIIAGRAICCPPKTHMLSTQRLPAFWAKSCPLPPCC